MLIALDYDKTYTLDKSFWNYFISSAQVAGHEVVLVTVRQIDLDWHSDFEYMRDTLGMRLFFTNGWPKIGYMENEGLKVDIWIDDNPKAVINGSSWGENHPDLAKWRADNKANGT